MASQGPVMRYAAALPPAIFAYVMATGVVSIGMHLVHRPWISAVLWVCASAGWLLLTLLTLLRAVRAPGTIASAARDGAKAFGFFTVVAGTCVLGVRFAVAGWDAWAVTLWLIGVAVWAVIGYAVPWLVALHGHRLGRIGTRDGQEDGTDDAARSAGGAPGLDLSTQVDGTWFVWVVATQSIAVLGAMLQPTLGEARDLVAVVVIVAWASGLGLYAVVGTSLVVRVLRHGIGVNELGPSFWVVMGALAISTLASGRIADMPQHSPAAIAVHGAAVGVSLVLWGLATWMVPMLLLLGIWRHLRRHVTARYTTELWAMVFPMGVYSVASMTVGATTHTPHISWAGQGFIWVALTAWVAVTVDWVVLRVRRRGSPAVVAAGAGAGAP